MSNLSQKILMAKRSLDSLAGGFATIILAISLPLTAWVMKPEQHPPMEMPTLIMQCDGREVLQWSGGDYTEIRNNIKKASQLIVSALYANDKNPVLVEVKGNAASKHFVEGTDAFRAFSNLMAAKIAKSSQNETSFTVEKVDDLFLLEHRTWVVETTGIYTDTTSTQGSVRVTLKIAFQKTEGLDPINEGRPLKNRIMKSLVVSHIEEVIHEATSADTNLAH